MHRSEGVLIFNPGSGKGKAAAQAKDFSAHWQKRIGSPLRLRPTQSRDDIQVAAQECGPETIPLFMGGDGTFSESLQGLAEKKEFQPLSTPVGLLPGGTGNSLLRDFDIANYPSARDALLQAIENNQYQTLDAALLCYQTVSNQRRKRIFVNIWGIALLADITVLAIKLRRFGLINYGLASLIKMLVHQPRTLQLVLNGERTTLLCNAVAVCNSRFTGGKMEIAPAIRLNDGQLFSVIPQFKSKRKLFSLFPKIFRGTHIQDPAVRTQFLSSLKVENSERLLMNIDGEIEQGYRPEISIQPAYWKIWMPRTIT